MYIEQTEHVECRMLSNFRVIQNLCTEFLMEVKRFSIVMFIVLLSIQFRKQQI